MRRIVLAVIVLVAACGDSAADTTTTTGAATTTAATTTTVAPTTTEAATTTTAAPTTTTEPAPVFAFLPDGLGVVDFGSSPEEVLAALTPILGEPTQDTGWIQEPICPQPLYRLIAFGPALFDFTVIFTTAEFFAPAGTEQFFGYSYGGTLAVPVSPPDLTVGTTLAQVEALYPALTVEDHPLIDDAYQGLVIVDGNERLDLVLDGNAPGSLVTEIRGGGKCGE